ncbi:Uncharacterised protein [Serratia fonticola]|uniref:hypothetical protein n=1 Tax=Serratia fonticola TaxID=47917 RepID=UPI002182C369|nr:hypothetical protein [Serratia fonticola]CAI2111567.1 Uncharacterised protein [Serratia fonticola]
MAYSAHFLNAEEYFSDIMVSVDINPFSDNAIMRKIVQVYKDNEPIITLRIFVATDEYGFIIEQCFNSVLVNDSSIAILYGQHVHLFDIESHKTNSIHLHDYVGHMYPVPNTASDILSESFIVTTFSYTFLINLNSGIIWQSQQCAIDGVVIYDIKDNVIYGSGEWDPPGGWRTFSLSLSNGEFVD